MSNEEIRSGKRTICTDVLIAIAGMGLWVVPVDAKLLQVPVGSFLRLIGYSTSLVFFGRSYWLSDGFLDDFQFLMEKADIDREVSLEIHNQVRTAQLMEVIEKLTEEVPVIESRKSELEVIRGVIENSWNLPGIEPPTHQLPPTSPEKIEAPKQPEKLPEALPKEEFRDSPKMYTTLKLPHEQAKQIAEKLTAEIGKTKCLKTLWGVNPGDNKPYKQALQEYQELIGDEQNGDR